MSWSLQHCVCIIGLLLATAAGAYEGVGLKRDEQAPDAGVPPAAPQLTKAPEVLQFVEAAYPPDALARGEAAQVAFLIDIDETGKVTQAEVTRSAGPGFDAAAREAVLGLVFSPAEVDGKPAPVRIEYVYHFVPRPPPPPEPAAVAAVEQAVNLRGRVLQRGTRDPIPNATVYLPGQELSAETDAEGRFELRGVTPGQVKVEISEPKHRKFLTTEEVKEGEVTELTAYLWKKIESGLETVVLGAREKKEVTRRTLQRQEVQTVPGTFGDPVRVLQNMPGMARAPYISGALLVRGAQPEDSQVMIDGVPIPLLYHFAGGPSVIAPSIIDRIDFFPGAYGAKYGRAIAGIVDVSTRPPEPKRLHGLVDIDLLDAGFYVEAPLSSTKNRGTLALAARRSYIDVLLPPLLEAFRAPGEASTAVSPYYWDYQGRYDLKLGKNRFELVAFGSSDSLSVSQAGSEDVQPFSLDTHQSFHRLRLGWSRPTDSGWKLSLSPTAGFTLTNIRFGQRFKGSLSSRDLNVRGAVEKELSQALSVETGIDLNAAFYELELEVPGIPQPGQEEAPPPIIRRQSIPIGTYAAYAEAVWSPIERWKLIPGVRLEAYRLPGSWQRSLEPRIATRFELSDQLTLKAAWGLFRQSPQPAQLDKAYGNPDLGLLRSRQTVAGLEWKLTEALLLDVQGFYNWRRQLVVFSRRFVEREGEQVPERYANAGRGRAYGLEVLLKHELTERFYGWVAYTLSRSEQLQRDAGYVPVEFDQSHILTLVGSYKLDNGWELGMRFRLTTGRPETPTLGSTFNGESGRYLPLEGEPGSARGVTFHQLDLRAEKQWTFERWRLSVYLDVQNIYNAANPEGTLWDYRYQESAPLRGLPILPTLGLKGEF